MSRSLPHLTLTTSTSSLSPILSTSPIFPTVSSSQTSPMILNPFLPCDGLFSQHLLASLTPLTGIRFNPLCNSTLACGPSGHVASPIPNTETASSQVPARTERRPSMRCRRSKAPLSDERAVEEVAGIFVGVSRHERYSQRDWQAWERIQKQARDQWTLSFITLCQPTLLKKWCIPKLKRSCFRGLPYHHVHQKIF